MAELWTLQRRRTYDAQAVAKGIKGIQLISLSLSLSIARRESPAAAQREPGFDLDRAAVDRVRLESPLSQRRLDALALPIGCADHMHMAYRPVAADDDASRDRNRRRCHVRGRDLADELVACRVVTDADRVSSGRQHNLVEA